MDDEAAFLRAICATPADDAPRLAFADWLDDRGQPGDDARAGLIRQMDEPYTFPADGSMFLTWQGRWDVEIEVPVVHPEVTWTVRRGFACGVRLPHAAFVYLLATERLFARCPIEAVGLTDRFPHRHSVEHYLWFREGADAATEDGGPHDLDPRVFEILLRHPAEAADDEARCVASFPTRDVAVLAASWALVNMGRVLVGLAPLPAEAGGGA
jgi:uncharacterized protein (TIGR02996 family)